MFQCVYMCNYVCPIWCAVLFKDAEERQWWCRENLTHLLTEPYRYHHNALNVNSKSCCSLCSLSKCLKWQMCVYMCVCVSVRTDVISQDKALFSMPLHVSSSNRRNQLHHNVSFFLVFSPYNIRKYGKVFVSVMKPKLLSCFTKLCKPPSQLWLFILCISW